MARPNISDSELDSIKRLLEDTANTEDTGTYSYDEIMAEYKYSSAVKSKKNVSSTTQSIYDIPVEHTHDRANQPVKHASRSELQKQDNFNAEENRRSETRVSGRQGNFVNADEIVSEIQRTVDDVKATGSDFSQSNGWGHQPRTNKAEPKTRHNQVKSSDESWKFAKKKTEPGPEFAELFTPEQRGVDEIHDDAEPVTKHEPLSARLVRHLKKKTVRQEINPQTAAARLAPYAASLRLRAMLSLVLLFPLLYITFAQFHSWPVPGIMAYTRHPYSFLFINVLLQVLIMFCGVDIVAKGFSDLYHLRPNIETLLVFSSMCSLANVFSILVNPTFFVGFLPYCSISSGAYFFALWGEYTLCKARLKTYKTAEGCLQTIHHEKGIYNDVSCFTKHEAGTEGFVLKTEEPDAFRRCMAFFTPILVVASILFAFIVSRGEGKQGYFFWALAAISCVCVPFTSFFVFSLPFSKVASRLTHMGAAIAGWSAAREFTYGNHIVVGDDDFFPAGTAKLNGFKVFGSYSFDMVTSYAASLLSASGSGLYKAMNEFLRNPQNMLHNITSFEHYEGGGVGGYIGNNHVFLGTASFMLRMGIRLEKELRIKSALFVAVNREVAGIVAINYIPNPTIENALHLLNNQKLTPVMAVRDFNVTPDLIKNKYNIDSEFLEYPAIEDRLRLSVPENGALPRPSAVTAKEGLNPYAESVVAGNRLYKVTRINLFVHMLSVLGGMLVVFYFTYMATSEAAISINPSNVAAFLFLWWVPIWLISTITNRY